MMNIMLGIIMGLVFAWAVMTLVLIEDRRVVKEEFEERRKFIEDIAEGFRQSKFKL